MPRRPGPAAYLWGVRTLDVMMDRRYTSLTQIFVVFIAAACAGETRDGVESERFRAPAEGARLIELAVLSECPAHYPACVEMTIDSRDLAAILDTVKPVERDGYSSFRVRVSGRLGNGLSGNTLLSLTAYTGGLECSAFGQASVAVVSFTARREPTFLTSGGEFTLDSESLSVGCRDCAQLVSQRGTDSYPAATVPAWDLRLIGARLGDIGYGDDGEIFISQKGRCLRIPLTGSVSQADATSCAHGSIIGSYGNPIDGIELGPGQWIIRVPGRRRLLKLNSGACS